MTTTYTTRAANTKAIRAELYAKQAEQKRAMRAYSDAMKAWREGGKVGEQPLMRDYWHW